MSWAKPLRPWLALRFLLAGMLPLLLVAALLLWVLLPQVLAEIETRHQALARAISGQVEVHLRSAGRELSAVAEYLQQRGLQPASFWFEPILDAHVGSGEVFAAIYVADAADSVYAVGLPPGQRRLRKTCWRSTSRAGLFCAKRASGRRRCGRTFFSPPSAAG
jgi:hypothetical protein